MPPKKKGGKGGTGGIIDGVDTSQMTREQLEVFVHRIKDENEREREERNFFQLERDKIRTFWEISKTELEETKAKLRNKDRQIEEEAEKNDEELKFYKQKVKHLQYEHQHDLTEARAQGLVSLKLAQDEHVQQERELLRDKRELKLIAKEEKRSALDTEKSIKLEYAEKLSKIREEYEYNVKQIEVKHEKSMGHLRTDMNNKHRMEINEIEERKDNHIEKLRKDHEKAFTDMKNYYNDITLNNLALISSLKDQMEILRKQNEHMSKHVQILTTENRKLQEPLAKALKDTDEYKRKLANYEKDKLSLTNTKNKLASTQKELSDLRWENEALELRYEKLESERDVMRKKFVDAIMEIQQKTSLKNVLLQSRIDALNDTLEKQSAVIGEFELVMQTESADKVNRKFAAIIDSKNAIIRELQLRFAKVAKAHDDLLEVYEIKLGEFGIPQTELGHMPMRYLPPDQSIVSKSPAGLVTENK